MRIKAYQERKRERERYIREMKLDVIAYRKQRDREERNMGYADIHRDRRDEIREWDIKRKIEKREDTEQPKMRGVRENGI